jgi:hypothetical protein
VVEGSRNFFILLFIFLLKQFLLFMLRGEDLARVRARDRSPKALCEGSVIPAAEGNMKIPFFHSAGRKSSAKKVHQPGPEWSERSLDDVSSSLFQLSCHHTSRIEEVCKATHIKTPHMARSGVSLLPPRCRGKLLICATHSLTPLSYPKVDI